MAKKLRIIYTSPLSSGFVLACTIVLVLSRFAGDSLVNAFFSAPAKQGSVNAFNWTQPIDYIRLFIHILGHKNALRFGTNAALILLLGPRLEERYGTAALSLMMLTSAFMSGICAAAFSPALLYGTDGIVFLMVILYSFAYAKKEGVFFTNILLFGLYLFGKLFPLIGKSEVQNGGYDTAALTAVFAHLLGGLCGSLFAFAAVPVSVRRTKAKPPSEN